MNQIVEDFKNNKFQLEPVAGWAKAAGKLADGMVGDKPREKFWKEILEFVLKKERDEARRYDKGYIYLRLAVNKLIGGESYRTVFKYLKFAQKEIVVECKKNINRIPEDTTPFRFEQILLCLLQYKNEDIQRRNIIDKHLNNPKERRAIHRTICNLYDLTFEPAEVVSLPWSPFDKLLGRNKYRASVNENYDAAVWLCARIGEIHRKTNLVQYGLAKAVIVLCGATIEGILAKDSRLQKIVALKGNRKQTLGTWIWAYLDNLPSPPDLTVMFLFLISIRNQIHPTNIHNKKILLDMKLAFYTLRLTEGIILRLSEFSKKRMRKY